MLEFATKLNMPPVSIKSSSILCKTFQNIRLANTLRLDNTITNERKRLEVTKSIEEAILEIDSVSSKGGH